MKKFILILFILLATLLSAQETIQLGNFDLEIPKDYSDLKNAYIIMASLYIESDIDLTISIQNFKDLKIEYDGVVLLLKESEEDVKDLTNLIDDELVPNAEKLEDEIKILTDELEKWIKPDLFQLYAGGSFSNKIIPEIQLGAFINLVIYEQYSIEVEYLLPDQYSIGFGYKLF